MKHKTSLGGKRGNVRGKTGSSSLLSGIGGVFAIVLGLVCWRCFPKSPKDTPLSTSENGVECRRATDGTSYCQYRSSLCYVPRRGFVLNVPEGSESTLMGRPAIELNEQLNDPPFHAPWLDEDFDTRSGPKEWQSRLWPYRSFSTEQVHVAHGVEFERLVQTSRQLRGNTSIIFFDAMNYNIYHFCNSVVAAFVGRLHLMEAIDRPTTNLAHTIDRLLSGKGFDTVMAWRPRPTDWQLHYADVVLGASAQGTRYEFLEDISRISEPVCFERAFVAGASLYLGSGVGNAQLIRRMTESIKGVQVREGHAWTKARFRVTWFVRDDKRQILNLSDVRSVTERIIAEYNRKYRAEVGLDFVHWTDQTPFATQAGIMGRTRVFISTHGSALNHCMFMETGGSVIEVNAHQFRYPLDDLIVLQQGHNYFRYSASMNETMHQGMLLGEDPFDGMSASRCNANPHCIVARRDAGVHMNLQKWSETFIQALEAV